MPQQQGTCITVGSSVDCAAAAVNTNLSIEEMAASEERQPSAGAVHGATYMQEPQDDP